MPTAKTEDHVFQLGFAWTSAKDKCASLKKLISHCKAELTRMSEQEKAARISTAPGSVNLVSKPAALPKDPTGTILTNPKERGLELIRWTSTTQGTTFATHKALGLWYDRRNKTAPKLVYGYDYVFSGSTPFWHKTKADDLQPFNRDGFYAALQTMKRAGISNDSYANMAEAAESALDKVQRGVA